MRNNRRERHCSQDDPPPMPDWSARVPRVFSCGSNFHIEVFPYSFFLIKYQCLASTINQNCSALPIFQLTICHEKSGLVTGFFWYLLLFLLRAFACRNYPKFRRSSQFEYVWFRCTHSNCVYSSNFRTEPLKTIFRASI